MSVKERLDQMNQRIAAACARAGRDTNTVKIIAVTKYVSLQRTEEALDAGIEHLGENRIEGALEKWEQLHDRAHWHFIGSLQTRKVKSIIGKYTYLHSLDRQSLAAELDKRLQKDEPINCFVQVNVSGEESKSGIAPEEVISFVQALAEYKGIRVIGLMTMAPFYEDPEQTRPVFQRLRELRDDVQALALDYAPCTELSMGMSNDFEVAIEEGATFVRIGSALVGSE